jgi:stalled ribosome alternative rescue factor ArfA
LVSLALLTKHLRVRIEKKKKAKPSKKRATKEHKRSSHKS